MYPTPNELSSYSPAWPCAHFRLAGGVNALAGVLFIFQTINQSKSRYGLDTKPTSSFYPFVRVYADLQIVDSADNEFLVLPGGSE